MIKTNVTKGKGLIGRGRDGPHENRIPRGGGGLELRLKKGKRRRETHAMREGN